MWSSMPSPLAVLAGNVGLYTMFISLLTIRTLQDHVIFLYRVKLTWFQDSNIPE
jgi:abhydrolase domain-containing protein 12